jgi:radical SAM protein with 4Fe4S-binding SPASM domain
MTGTILNPALRLALRHARRLGFIDFERLWQAHSVFPRQIGLSLSLLCPSNCIYCAERGIGIPTRIMPLPLVRKLLAEAAAADFAGAFSLSENGEALVHPEFKTILKELRARFPRNEIILFTNMVLLDAERARDILEQGVNCVRFNFDGASADTYEYVKRNRQFDRVKRNIVALFKARQELASPCRIGVGFVTARAFAAEIEGCPSAFPDDTAAILDFFAPLLRPGDEIGADEVTLEKYQPFLKRPKREPCDLWRRVLDEIMVAPNGQVYICCADYGVSSSLGNLNEQTIREIWSGAARHGALRHIFRQEYDQAFAVCRTCLPSYNYRVNRDVFFRVRRQVRQRFEQGRLKFVDGQLAADSAGRQR